MIKNADATLFGKDSPGAAGPARHALQEVTRAARTVRVLVDYLERHPEALIRGKTEEKTMMRRLVSGAVLCVVAALAAGCASRRRRASTR